MLSQRQGTEHSTLDQMMDDPRHRLTALLIAKQTSFNHAAMAHNAWLANNHSEAHNLAYYDALGNFKGMRHVVHLEIEERSLELRFCPGVHRE